MRFIVLEGVWKSVACESGTFFLHIYPLGFANCQPILYISNVGKTSDCVLGVNVNEC